MSSVDVGWFWAQVVQAALCCMWQEDVRWLWSRLDAVNQERTRQEAWAARKYFEATGGVLPYRPSTLDVGRHPWMPDEASCPSGWRPQRRSAAEVRPRTWWWPTLRRVILLLLVLLAGCAAAPPRPTEAERAAAFHQQVMVGLRSLEAYCATRPDPRACERAVLQVWSRPVVLPSAPPPPRTIIIQQPPVPRRPRDRYWGPRTPYGVPSVPGIVPVYPIE